MEKERERRLRPAGQELHCASRSFFTRENEVLLVRLVALALGMLPATGDVLGFDRCEFDQVIDVYAGFSNAFLEVFVHFVVPCVAIRNEVDISNNCLRMQSQPIVLNEFEGVFQASYHGN